MPNLQPLIDAVAFVKANPDKHNQGHDSFTSETRCIISYAGQNAGLTGVTYNDSRRDLAEKLGIDFDEVDDLYQMDSIYMNSRAIEYAEQLIAKYSPAPVVNEPYYIAFDGYEREWTGSIEDAKVIARFLSDAFDNVSITRTITEKVDF